MKFDFLDIGTCDFDTSADKLTANPTAKILLVEPLKFYLDNIPSNDNILKVNVAIGKTFDTVDVFYLEQETITKFHLPEWLRGCNRIGRPHWLALQELSRTGLSIDLVKSYNIEMISFKTLCDRYNITSIGQLKIDTEGYEHMILPEVYEEITNGLNIQSIIFEYHPSMGHTAILDELSFNIEQLGYVKSWLTSVDIKLDKIGTL